MVDIFYSLEVLEDQDIGPRVYLLGQETLVLYVGRCLEYRMLEDCDL